MSLRSKSKDEWLPPGADGWDDTPDVPERPDILGGPSWLNRVFKPKSPIALIVILMAIAVAVVVWTEGDPRQTVRIRPPWTNGELSSFTILSATGSEMGSIDLGVIMEPEDGHVGQVKFIHEFHSRDLDKRCEIIADANTLKPMSSTLDRESALSGHATITAEYGDTTASVGITSQRGTEQADVTLPETKYFDSEQVLYVLRSLPMHKRFKASINPVDPASAKVSQVIVQVVGKETISVPAGDFDCWRVDLRGMGMRAWISASEPYQLVAFDDTARNTHNVLVSYTTGEAQ